MCSVCTYVNGIKYERISSNTCSKCINAYLNGFRIAGFILILLIYIAILIAINLRAKGNWSLSVLTRILTNYIQIVSSTLSMNLAYPSYITDIFSPFTSI